jgi:hypothetical protein
MNKKSQYFIKYFNELFDRLDENYYNPRYDLIDELLKKSKFNDIIKLGDNRILKRIVSGKTPKGIKYVENGVPFLGSTQVNDGRVHLETAPKIPIEIHNSLLRSSQIKVGNVLITIAGTYIGRCAVYNNNDECNCNQAIALLPEFIRS